MVFCSHHYIEILYLTMAKLTEPCPQGYHFFYTSGQFYYLHAETCIHARDQTINSLVGYATNPSNVTRREYSVIYVICGTISNALICQ